MGDNPLLDSSIVIAISTVVIYYFGHLEDMGSRYRSEKTNIYLLGFFFLIQYILLPSIFAYSVFSFLIELNNKLPSITEYLDALVSNYKYIVLYAITIVLLFIQYIVALMLAGTIKSLDSSSSYYIKGKKKCKDNEKYDISERFTNDLAKRYRNKISDCKHFRNIFYRSSFLAVFIIFYSVLTINNLTLLKFFLLIMSFLILSLIALAQPFVNNEDHQITLYLSGKDKPFVGKLVQKGKDYVKILTDGKLMTIYNNCIDYIEMKVDQNREKE